MRNLDFGFDVITRRERDHEFVSRLDHARRSAVLRHGTLD